MQYWLFKSEPGAWSWDDQCKKVVEHWDGVRNHQANNYMKAMMNYQNNIQVENHHYNTYPIYIFNSKQQHVHIIFGFSKNQK